jgi:hypothetical protein
MEKSMSEIDGKKSSGKIIVIGYQVQRVEGKIKELFDSCGK